MERKMIRLTLAAVLVMTCLAFFAVAIHATNGCPTYVNCPMHNQNANMTGHTEYVNGHQWAEFICYAGSAPHKFLVCCDCQN